MNKFMSTRQLARLLVTSEKVIRHSRETGILYGAPAPAHEELSNNRVAYEIAVIYEWLDTMKNRPIT